MARKGWREYYHMKQGAETETVYHDKSHTATSTTGNLTVAEFREASSAIDTACGNPKRLKSSANISTGN